jgi:hypothetical protein
VSSSSNAGAAHDIAGGTLAVGDCIIDRAGHAYRICEIEPHHVRAAGIIRARPVRIRRAQIIEQPHEVFVRMYDAIKVSPADIHRDRRDNYMLFRARTAEYEVELRNGIQQRKRLVDYNLRLFGVRDTPRLEDEPSS